MTGAILVGGMNSRIGLKKAFLEIGEKRIIDRTVEIYRSIFDEIIIITDTPEDYRYLKLKTYTDLTPHRGSMGGIYTGLFYSKSDYTFFTACDMPFINENVINQIISEAKGDYDIIVPYFKHRLHPLHAVYSMRCMETFKIMVEEQRLKIKDIFLKFRVKRVADIAEIEPPPFFNINTMEDFKQAGKIYSAWLH
ncbi:MAG: hypothetical protein A3I04_05595 [Nitrospinae bacterium RIFCSPLOWO2_02_FULL_39_110]|nr:MAG: hypothetical protein A3D97_07425 [Nitrospinae bacterium RIFCSPHIGHO2_12_FULL_39_42]OGW01134.1 MAG: hypothetical protein A3D20_04515 [Nitrospinae bacterium RIFCSPHIGHO2_02_FULL_39_82]OGW04815.1 MAG: hypothetical protein A3I04_05595 [Nitrospinae bacterium RIFCSPLOWO2_02_FULL_39_110]OGW06863.1 MAG: hypothetical protein A2Z59_08855 [Nitrospinae bacterium RIFCSPLOWO2_02_39_17]OGW10138.1 MAG: hypothetical protein A3F81_06685 [Nitrospinae bacterium RIFCSPLOWO2_12_FULL_39_93]OGW11235.1 MAG: hy